LVLVIKVTKYNEIGDKTIGVNQILWLISQIKSAITCFNS
jgi:hypothetical protein